MHYLVVATDYTASCNTFNIAEALSEWLEANAAYTANCTFKIAEALSEWLEVNAALCLGVLDCYYNFYQGR